MQFKQPEILYALLLLIIPIIVHLFQLQRFSKTPFTNVQFLKQLKLETRKSSKLKKWLILATRMLAFLMVIFAFSQPYFSNLKKNQKFNTVIYLDNSMSMQLKNQGAESLKTITQKIIENTQNHNGISLITNDKILKNLTANELKRELLNVNYSTKKLNLNTILLKANKLNINKSNTLNNVILLSDFQIINNIKKQYVTNVNSHITLINTAKSSVRNISIDNLSILKNNTKEITLKVVINNSNIDAENFSISLYNDTFLVGKTTTTLLQNKPSEVEFKISSQENFNGIIRIEDENLTFDNSFFFTISKPEKINVISIGKRTHFLSKIYTKNEFNFKQKNLKNLDYNNLQNQNLIILNEIDKIPVSLSNTLLKFSKNGGNIVVIPSEKSNINSYNQFFDLLKSGSISKFIKKELKITTLNFSHSILNDVFEKQIQNFQYPTVNQYFKINTNNSSPIISFENQQEFVSETKTEKGSIYLFASALNKNITNFTDSPLVVPLFYNFGKYSFKIPQLYYTIGKENSIEIKTSIKKDEILKLKNKTSEFIPLQNVLHNKVQLNTSQQPIKSGFYKITNKNKVLRSVAYNYNREESNLNYANLNELFKDSDNVSISNSIENTFTQLNDQQKIKSLFKWFLAFAILFLLLEIFILKFFKV